MLQLESEYTEEDDVDENIDWVDTDEEEEKNDDDDDKSIDLENTDDEKTDDEFVHSDEYVNDDVDDEMNDADVAETGKDKEEITDTTKEEAEKTKEVKDDDRKAELPPTSSSLSVSLDAEINSLLDIKIQSEVPHIQSPLILTVLVSVISEHSILPPIPETTTTTSPVISTITPVLQQQSTPIPTSLITIKALTFTTAVPETPTITTVAFNVVQLRVADLEKDVTKLKKVNHSTEILAAIRSHVPAVKQSIDLEQEPTKSTSKILKVKKEQADKQKMTKYTIKSTDRAALNEYDLKHALFQSKNDSKSFNKHSANQVLYHDLIEALIADEEAMDKGVADSLKQQKRLHGDDDEDPSAEPNQGKKTTRTRTKDLESSKKTPTTKETSKGKAPTKGSKAGKSATAEESVKEIITDVVMDDAVNPAAEDVVLDDTPEEPWFNKLLSAEKDPLTFDALMDTLIDFSKFSMNQLKIDKLTKEHLVGPVYNLLKGTCTSSIELEYNMEECFKALTDKLDWNNPEGDHYPFDLTKPLLLKGRPGRLTVAVEYFFNNDLEFLKSSEIVKKYTMSITKTKATRYEIVGIEDMIVVRRADRQRYKFKEGDFIDLYLNDIEDMLFLDVQHKLFQLEGSDIVDFIVALRSYQKKLNRTKPQKTFPGIEFKELYTPSFYPPGVIYKDLNKQKRVMWADELYNDDMPRRKWSGVDKTRMGLMVDLIDKQMLERWIMRNLE
ncbi:hypothetical protein Tco_0157284 [Tanacetum coccineum]